VQGLSLSSSDPAPNGVFTELRDQAAGLGLALSFDLPVPYSADNPVALETKADDVPSGAGRAWLYVEPDGDVLPAQGMVDQLLGNFLRDDWTKIYPQREPATG
jgi:hypothetical protein